MTAHFDYGRDRSYYEAQGDFFREVSAFAQAHNVHVHVVAHPRKHQGEISNDDIAGTKSLVNLAQNVFTVSRGKTENSSMVEIKKHRDTGTKDKKMFFRFEPESKRFYMSNEVLRFGWEGQIKSSIFDEMGEKM
jgi:twinkle protein